MKKITSIVLAVALTATMCMALCACGTKSGSSSAKADAAASDSKIGVILVGDETEGYTKAHIDGIKAAMKKLNIADSQVEWKYKIAESEDCYNSAKSLVADGCKLVISNSYGHQDFMFKAAKEFADANFVSMTGDYAAICGLKNFSNAFTNVYESRFVSGVVAGMKLKELVDNGTLTAAKQPKSFDKDGNIKIGYVGAYNYAEVVSGYTAFYLGIKSIVENVAMQVTYTNSWFDHDAEGAVAKSLIADGCVIIGQHADSTGAPEAVEKAQKDGTLAYSVGYNVDMLEVAPKAALTSATNVWEVYYEVLFDAYLNGKEIPQNWSEGYAKGAVAITALGESCAKGTDTKVEEIETAIKDGTLHVFDTSKFTVGGKKITENKVDMSYMDFTKNPPEVVYQGETVDTVKTDNGVSYVDESTFRSAPYFSLRIDGITENKSK